MNTQLHLCFPTEAAAEAALVAEGFARRDNGHFAKRSMTGGNLFEAPRRCVALCSVKHNRVDPKWSEPDYYTVVFH